MINAHCFYSGEGGWARHAQSFLQAFAEFESVALIPFDGPLDAAALSPHSRQMLLHGETASESDPCLGIGSIECMQKMKGSWRAGFVVWESSILPASKVEILCGLDEVWTPSEWGRQLLVRNGIPGDKVCVVPAGVDSDLFRPLTREHIEGGPFRFLCVGKWEVRKGIDDLVRAFSAEFREGEDVELVLHCFNQYQPYLNLEDRVRQLAPRRHAPIRISAPRARAEMVNLYSQANAFVLPSRAEGWGLPLMEAMSCALPVIATDYSAPTDFLHEGNAYLIRVERMVDVFDPYFFPDSRELGEWAQPDTAHLRELMRHVVTHRGEAEEKGRRARREVCERWTWRHGAEIAHRRLRPERYA